MTTRRIYYAFAVNEYQYRRIPFSVHYNRVAAERAAHKFAGPYRGNATSDMTEIVFEGKDKLIEWTQECAYEIDWKQRVLVYKGSR